MSKQIKGFTLIELMVVISIISLMSSVVLASLNVAREKGRVAAAKKFAGYTFRALGADAQLILNFELPGTPFSTDESGNNYVVTQPVNSTANLSTTNTPSGFGRAAQFDGTTDNLTIATPVGSELRTSMDPGKSFTFSTWFNPIGPPTTSSEGYIFFRDGSSNTNFGIFYNTNNKFCGASHYTNGTSDFFCGTGSIKYNQWYNIALTVNDQDKTINLYVDGQRVVNTVSYSGKVLKTYTTNFYVGGRGGVFWSKGIVDEARFYTSALTSAQVQQLYALGSSRKLTSNQ